MGVLRLCTAYRYMGSATRWAASHLRGAQGICCERGKAAMCGDCPRRQSQQGMTGTRPSGLHTCVELSLPSSAGEGNISASPARGTAPVTFTGNIPLGVVCAGGGGGGVLSLGATDKLREYRSQSLPHGGQPCCATYGVSCQPYFACFTMCCRPLKIPWQWGRGEGEDGESWLQPHLLGRVRQPLQPRTRQDFRPDRPR